MNLRALKQWFTQPRGEHRRVGDLGERLAAKHLKQNRYRILARNPRTAHGEIDLLALTPDRKTLVIVEVKTNAAASQHAPELRVNKTKQRKLITLGSDLARRHKLTHLPLRFDIIAVELHTTPPTIRHHPAAFNSHV